MIHISESVNQMIPNVVENMLKNNSLREVIKIAAKDKNFPIQDLQAVVLEKGEERDIYLLAKLCEGVDLDALERRMIEISSLTGLMHFAEDIYGSDTLKIFRVVIDKGTKDDIWKFAKMVWGNPF